MQFHKLQVAQKTAETTDTTTLELAIPAELTDLFQYRQGQYITIKATIGGKEIRRAYSMSSSPLDKTLAVSVKKVKGGQMSTWLHDIIKTGDSLEVAEPEGRFTNVLDVTQRRTYYLIGSGSGITPLMSILKTVLEAEPMSSVFLLYGSRDEENIIFRQALDTLSERYTGQLMVEYVLSQPPKQSGGLFGMFKKSTSNWQGRKGRIDATMIGHFIDDNAAPTRDDDCLYFICGPGNMADNIKTALVARGVESKQIHTELFLNAHHIPGEDMQTGAAGGKTARVTLNGQQYKVTVPPGASILDALVKEKLDPPYSCTSGACSTCMAKLSEGKVTMDACYALDDEEVKNGYILTCQAKPDTDVVLSFD
jgi:ring-1,2-phenylacetyl-CoA epoxidase subunit PaaE